MKLTVTTDLSGTITRQTLADMWSNASIPPIATSDLDPAFQPVFVGTNFSDASASLPNPNPGHLFWHQQHGLMYVFTDMLDVLDTSDATGVSLWLAIGPDSFETACIAAEPIPAGAVVEPYYDRWVKVFRPDAGNFAGETLGPAPLGVNQSGILDDYDPQLAYGTTAESGAWIRVGIDGYVRIWHPAAQRVGGDPASGVSEAALRITVGTTQINNVGCPPDGSPYLGAGIGNNNNATAAGPYTIGQTIHNVTVPSGYTAAYPFINWQGWGCVRFRNDVL